MGSATSKAATSKGAKPSAYDIEIQECIQNFRKLNKVILNRNTSVNDVLKFLQEKGLNRDKYITVYNSAHPPFVALEGGFIDKFEALVSSGFIFPDPEVRFDADVLLNVCRRGNLSLVRTLVEQNTKMIDNFLRRVETFDSQYNESAIPLFAAMEFGHYDIVEYLIENGIAFDEVDIQRRNILHFPHSKIPSRVFENLISKGVDLHKLDKSKSPPLYKAAGLGCRGVVHAFIKAGASVNVDYISYTGRRTTPLEHAISSYRVQLNRVPVTYEDDEDAYYIPIEYPGYGENADFEHVIASLLHAGFDFDHRSLDNLDGTRFSDWGKRIKSTPRSLTDLCILRIRGVLNGRLLTRAVEQLQLPKKLQSMVRLEHVIPSEHEVIYL